MLEPARIGGMFATLLLVGWLAAAVQAQQPPPHLSSFDRGLALTMLKQTKEDLKQNYYDPAFHGVDIDKVFADAEARIRTAQSTAEVSAILADTLMRLDDSHTVFYPPERLTKVEYGWGMTIVGDDPYVTWVNQGSDAEKKGLAKGDRILSWNRFEPSRKNLWQLSYVYHFVRPQQLQRIVVRKPDGSERTIDVESKITARPRGEIEDLFRAIDDASGTPLDWEKAAGDTLVVSLGGFGDPKDVERFMKKARGYKSLVLDLRGNPGGRVSAINMLVSWCFDSEIRIGTLKMRSGDEPEVAKGRKDAFPAISSCSSTAARHRPRRYSPGSCRSRSAEG
jgi:C-terminal processing protease CtpA/Prc